MSADGRNTLTTGTRRVVLVAAALVLVQSGMRRWAETGVRAQSSLDRAQIAELAAQHRPPLFGVAHRDTAYLFLDFECEPCAAIYPSVASRHAPYALVVVPVAMTGRVPLGKQAALAVACAQDSGRVYEYSYALFSRRDSIGIRSWAYFATLAGVSDTLAFEACVTNRSRFLEVERNAKLAVRLGVTATPTAFHAGTRSVGMEEVAALLRRLPSQP